MSLLVRHFCVFCSALSASAFAIDNPELVVDASEQLVFDQGQLVAMRHIWVFDQGYSGFAMRGLGTADRNGSDPVLVALAKVDVDQLREFDFFTSISADGAPEPFAAPTDYALEFHDGRLALSFTLPLTNPIDVRSVTVQIQDPQSYVVFSLPGVDHILLDHAPANCRVRLVPATRSSDSQPTTTGPRTGRADARSSSSIIGKFIAVNC